MRTVTFILLFIPSIVHSAVRDDPYEVFDMSKRFYDTAVIEVHTVDDANERCQKESRKRGFGGFPYKVEACTFWADGSNNKCTIYLPKRTNMHQLGHEVRHCYQGPWHE